MRSMVRIVAGVVIGLFALTVAFGFPYSLVSEYGGFGSSPAVDVVTYAALGLITGAIAGAGGWLASRRPGPSFAVGVLLSLAAAVTGGVLGQQVKDQSQHNIATACSPVELAELRALGTVPSNGEHGSGNSDGSCSGTLGERSFDKSKLTDQRWVEVRPGEFQRDGKTLLVEIADEGEKGQNITLRFPG